MFESFDDNKDGIIDAGELAQALKHYKYAYPIGSCCAMFLLIRIWAACILAHS
jgi:Ca2+-binding EF-hand superfamily protein